MAEAHGNSVSYRAGRDHADTEEGLDLGTPRGVNLLRTVRRPSLGARDPGGRGALKGPAAREAPGLSLSLLFCRVANGVFGSADRVLYIGLSFVGLSFRLKLCVCDDLARNNKPRFYP